MKLSWYSRVKIALCSFWEKLRGRSPVFGRDWNYDDERRDRVIGYLTRDGRLLITDRKTWLEILP